MSAIEWAMGNTTSPIVFNMSWVYPSDRPMLEKSINKEWDTGRAVFVGIAIRENTDAIGCPAGYNNVIAVTGVTSDDVKGRDAGYGAYIDVSAPVEDVPTVAYNAETGEHISWSTKGTTPSISAAQVSAIAALVWSKYPALSNAGVRRQIEHTTDDIRAANRGRPWSGRIGSGRVNAYRALTEWSGPLQVRSGQTLTWSGTIRVTGDVTIPSGVTLTLASGTEVLFLANRDDTNGGTDSNKAELIVAGTLIASAGNITFRSANDNPAANEWSGIRVRSGGSATLTNVTVRDGVHCVQAEAGGTLTQTNVTLLNCGDQSVVVKRKPGRPRNFTATAGQPVRTLLDMDALPAGSHAVEWDARDDQGRPVASGVYLLRWTWQGQSSVQKVTLLR